MLRSKLLLVFAVAYCFFAALAWFSIAVSAAPSTGQPPLAVRLAFERTESVLNGLWHAYAPSVLSDKGVKRMWFGGWLTEQDTGSDQIYYSEKTRSSWSQPVRALRIKGYAVNDPTVIKHPFQNRLLMFFTMLSEEAQKSASRMVRENQIGLASSSDNGKTWQFQSIVVGQDNGINGHGGWAPSAVLSIDRRFIHLYYHTNSPSNVLLRTVLDLDGQTKRSTDQVVFEGGNGLLSPLQAGRINVDVKRMNGGKIAMLTNEMSLSDVALYYAGIDGLSFRKARLTLNPFIAGGANLVLTPTIETINDREVVVYFGYGTRQNTCASQWAAAGIDLACSASIHAWNLKFVGEP